jgi:hypothetical protein
VLAPPPLVRLLTTLGDDVAVTDWLPRSFDCHCPLMSLPLACRTTLATVPSEVPYLLADRVWSSLPPLNGAVLRVGLAWSGNQQQARNVFRSLPFAEVAPLFSLPIQYVGLQKEVDPRDAGGPLINLGPSLHDFANIAAVIDALDLVMPSAPYSISPARWGSRSGSCSPIFPPGAGHMIAPTARAHWSLRISPVD